MDAQPLPIPRPGPQAVTRAATSGSDCLIARPRADRKALAPGRARLRPGGLVLAVRAACARPGYRQGQHPRKGAPMASHDIPADPCSGSRRGAPAAPWTHPGGGLYKRPHTGRNRGGRQFRAPSPSIARARWHRYRKTPPGLWLSPRRGARLPSMPKSAGVLRRTRTLPKNWEIWHIGRAVTPLPPEVLTSGTG